jgi:hypothetical protein
MAQADADSIGENVPFPLRLPTAQERADELLLRWRLARAAGIPAAYGSDPVDLHGAVIIDPIGMAQLVLDALAKAGFEFVVSDH